VFFGASDGPMTNEQLQAAPGKLLHFPTVLGGVVPVYNVPGFSQELKFTGPVLANIFLGTITKWNDPQIAKLNPGVNLPGTDITVVHRSDGSGTTYIWVDYLSKVAPEFKKQVGVATSVKWPAGIGGKGNEGVAGLVSQTPGAIGYVELIYALQNKISYGSVQNMAGKFLKASIETVTAAAAGAAGQMPADFRVSITNAPGDNAYPISSFTWLLLYQNPADKQQSKVMVDFAKWALTDGQQFAAQLGYAPLPKNVVDMELKALASIKIQ
jgi:phosphate transport system substrate-binding protein